MNTTEFWLESRGPAHRSTLDTTHGLADHDPTAHRHAVELDATLRVSGGELRVQVCRLRSLSLGGAFVEIEGLPVGTLVNITFGLPSVDERLSLDAIVHWCADDGISVLFDSLRAWEVWMLWRFLASLEDDEVIDDDDEEIEPTTRIGIAVLPVAAP